LNHLSHAHSYNELWAARVGANFTLQYRFPDFFDSLKALVISDDGQTVGVALG